MQQKQQIIFEILRKFANNAKKEKTFSFILKSGSPGCLAAGHSPKTNAHLGHRRYEPTTSA